MKYCHSTPELEQKAVDKLGALIGGAMKSGHKAAISKLVPAAVAAVSVSNLSH
jgi:hypothetical protein